MDISITLVVITITMMLVVVTMKKNHYLVKRVFFSIENQIHKFFLVGFENKDRSILKLNLKLFQLYFWSNILFQKIYLFKNNKNLRSP